jgi:FixJ family two-component response regulator
MSEETVLFVDDEEHLRLAVEQSLQLAELDVTCLSDGEAALANVSRTFPGILVTDIRMEGLDGLTLMRRCLDIDPAFPVVLVTGHGDVDLAVQSMRDGAYDFLEKTLCAEPVGRNGPSRLGQAPADPGKTAPCAARSVGAMRWKRGLVGAAK